MGYIVHMHGWNVCRFHAVNKQMIRFIMFTKNACSHRTNTETHFHTLWNLIHCVNMGTWMLTCDHKLPQSQQHLNCVRAPHRRNRSGKKIPIELRSWWMALSLDDGLKQSHKSWHFEMRFFIYTLLHFKSSNIEYVLRSTSALVSLMALHLINEKLLLELMVSHFIDKIVFCAKIST